MQRAPSPASCSPASPACALHPRPRAATRSLGLLTTLCLLWALLTCASCASPASALASPPDPLLDAMRVELQRSMQGLKFDDFSPPYFMSYTLRDTRSLSLNARYGSLDTADDAHARQAYVQVRVGSPQFDNFAHIEGESARMSELFVSDQAPLDDDPLALRQTLWLLTDDAYKDAMSAFLAKQGTRVFAHEDRTKIPSFSPSPSASPSVHADPPTPPAFDRPALEDTLRATSRFLAQQPHILDSSARASIEHLTRHYVNSEGASITTHEVFFGLHISAQTRAEDGMLLSNDRSLYARAFSDLPDQAALLAISAQLTSELAQLRDAPVMEPYIGPAILAPEATGVLFHEAIGHRLEGERQLNEEEGQTFKGQLGQAIIPTFLSVSDDPTRARFGDTQLNGFYRFDDEGTPAQPAVLIEDGVLRGFILSRKPVFPDDRSNGHARAQGSTTPIARMANLIVSSSPEHTHDLPTLKAMLLEELKRQQKPFGLIIQDITGGSTNTSGYGYQAFKGSPRLVYRVDAATGQETLVRGVEIVGTPLTAISKIIAAGDSPGIFNGYCGAESGYVPVSTIAPAVLLTELELQRTQSLKERSTLLPPPLSATP
jgi:TldD protein